MTFRVDTPDRQLAFDTEAEAEQRAAELVRGGAKVVVVWEQGERE